MVADCLSARRCILIYFSELEARVEDKAENVIWKLPRVKLLSVALYLVPDMQ